MRHFARLLADLDASTASQARLAALQRYLAQAPAADAAWGVYLLAGGRPKLGVPAAVLRSAATRQADIPGWLFDACHRAVGDLAETIAQVLPPPRRSSALGLSHWLTDRLLPLRGAAPADQAAALAGWWDELPLDERWLLARLVVGGRRALVSGPLLKQALAGHAGLDVKLVAQRLLGWADQRCQPNAERLQALLAPPTPVPASAPATATDAASGAAGQPFPFWPAQVPLLHLPLAALDEALGPVSGWLAEWHWDGLRAQLVCEAGGVWLWSSGDELVNDRFPEVLAWARGLPLGTVLDGELQARQPGLPPDFNRLAQRLNRQTPSRALLASAPVRFVASDLLAWQGQDRRNTPLAERRRLLAAVLEGQPGHLSPCIPADSWAALAQRRARSHAVGAMGLLLKRLDQACGAEVLRAWRQWPAAPCTVDAVLVYAQAGPARRSGQYADYTFAVWTRQPAGPEEAAAAVAAWVTWADAPHHPLRPAPGALQLRACTKAYSGLSGPEHQQVAQVIGQHTLGKFGPVRSVRPILVAELAFDGIAASPRHACGLVLRLPRLLRLRLDTPLHEAGSLPGLMAWLPRPVGLLAAAPSFHPLGD